MSSVKNVRASVAQPVVQFNVKLTPKAGQQTVKRLSAFPGVKQVVQTFPDENDPELSRLYVLKLNPARAKLAMKKLREHPDVEYVEETPTRKLIW